MARQKKNKKKTNMHSPLMKHCIKISVHMFRSHNCKTRFEKTSLWRYESTTVINHLWITRRAVCRLSVFMLQTGCMIMLKGQLGRETKRHLSFLWRSPYSVQSECGVYAQWQSAYGAMLESERLCHMIAGVQQAVAALSIEGAKIGAAEFLSIRLLLVGQVWL